MREGGFDGADAGVAGGAAGGRSVVWWVVPALCRTPKPLHHQRGQEGQQAEVENWTRPQLGSDQCQE